MNGVLTILRIPIEELDRIVDMVSPHWEKMRSKRLLLTGGTGFIGKWLLATFLRANQRLKLSAHIIVLSRSPERFINEHLELREAVELTWLSGDVRDLPPKAIGDCDFAIHAATDVVTKCTPVEILDTCVEGTRRVLDAMSLGSTKRRVLLLSSGAIYGRTPPEIQAIPEDWAGAPDPLVLSSAYGEGKRVSELLGAIAAGTRPGLEIIIARCFAFVGPHLPLNKHFAIGNFISAAMRNKDIYVQGDGTPLRSYLYASDLAHWLWVMLFDAPSGRPYNVGGSESISIGELAHRVNRVLNGCGRVRIAQTSDVRVAPQAYVPAIDRIASELNLNPTVSLDEAIIRTARWAAQQSREKHEESKYK